MSTYIRKLAHNMPYLGHSAYCHCPKCWMPSRSRAVFEAIKWPGVPLAMFGFLLYHVIKFAVSMPWAMRIGQ